MRSIKITLFFILALNCHLLKAQYSQGFEPVSGNSASIITILRSQCWNIDGLSVNAGGVTPITAAQSFVTGTAANTANRGFITPYMTFDGTDSVAIKYKYYGTAGNFQRWFLLKIISDLGQVTTIDSVFINTSVNTVINFNKTITGFTGKFKVFINYRGSGAGIAGSRTGFDDFFFSGNYFYPTGCRDTDFDGVVDTKDVDDDNDGISDAVEVCGVGAVNFSCLGSTPITSDPARDADGDGIDNFLDPQFCTLNTNGVCTNLDFDGDGIPNHIDLDSDNDGIPDAIEANNGVAPTNFLNGVINSPVGPNGMPNSAETATNTGISNFPLTNTDAQGRPDYLDIDADNDGIVDNIEAQGSTAYIPPVGIDTDRDGVDNAYDNQAGLFATGIVPVNTDNADNPDYVDTDTDNDARNDIVEAHDSNGNNSQDGAELAFSISGIDTDNDGLDNIYDLINGNNATNGGQTANDFPDAQFGTAERDWREAPFIPEICNNGIDDDGDGFADCFDSDCGLPVIDSVTVTNAGPCTNVSNGTLVIHSVNATAYSIDSAANFSIDSLFSNLAAGFYSIVVQNSNGCTAAAINNPIEITSINCAPVAVDDNFSTNQNTTLNGTSLINNDNSTDGPALNINTIVVSGPANGAVTINPDGTFIYIPNNGFFGNDQFEYVICDGAGVELCDTGLVTINVIQINQSPNIINESFITSINTPVNGNILINDTDPDGTLVVTIIPVQAPVNGAFITDTAGNFTYTPNNGFTGVDTIVVLVCDNNNACTNDTLFITILNNNAPVVLNESISTNEDNAASGNILLNDSDSDGTLTANVVPVVNPVNGVFIINLSGDFTYTPNLNFNGFDTVVVAVCDNLGACVNDTLFISITPVNDLPIINNETIVVQVSTPFNGNILSNDSDVEGPLTTSILPLFGPLNGSILMASNGDFTYSPNIGFQGIDLVWFSVCDNNGVCINDTIFITVTNTNIPPTVVNENISVNEDTQAAGNILTNDTDLDGTLSVSITPVQTPSNGLIFMNANGDFTYIPDPDFFGTDLAIFQVCDNAGACINDTIFISVNSINDLPVVTNDFYTTNQDQTLNNNIILNDTDIETALLVTVNPLLNTSNGVISMQTNGDFSYVPNPGFNGADTAVFLVCDNDGGCLNDTIFITVLPLINQPPIIVNDSYTLQVNTFISDKFTLNDTDLDGFLIVDIIPVVDVANGVLTYDNIGNFIYTPNAGFEGSDTAVINICDDDGACILDTLFFEVTPVNILPVVINDFYTINEDGVVIDNFLLNDFSNQGILTATLITTTSNGTLILGQNGQIVYTPNPNFNGIDTAIALVCDVNAICINDTMFFTVLPVSDPIIVNNENYTIPFNSGFSDNILSNDSDVDGTLTVIIPQITGPSNGIVVINSDGSFTYTPDNGFAGFDTIIVQVCSSSGPCQNDTLFFQINIVNTPPDVNNESFTTNEDTPLSGNILSNDSDLEGAVIVVSPPSIVIPFGTLNIDVAGNFIFTPNANYFGTFQVVILVCDNVNVCENDTLTITVTPVNDLPSVNNESYTTSINVPVADNLLSNDSDIEGPLTAGTIPIYGPVNGTIIISANGDFIYTPDFNFSGFDTIVVSVCDTGGACINDTIFITVPAGNTFPVVENETFNATQDQIFVGNILTNDFDLETGLIVNITPIVDLANGLISMFANGAFTYAPNSGFVGNDFAVFSVCDLDGACVNDTVFFIVSPVANIAPNVFNDFYTVVQDGSITDNLLNNDSDPDGTILAGTVPVINPANGIISIQANGSFTYTPNSGFVGLDTVVVQVCDNGLACVNDTLFFTVTPVNSLPTVNNESFTTSINVPVADNLLINDSDIEGPLTASTIPVYGPVNGTIIISANGDFIYTPDFNFSGSDTIVVSVCDTDGACINDTIFITVPAGNTFPVVENETFNATQDQIFVGNILTNDFDLETGLIVNITPIVDLANGLISMFANGSFTYAPNSGFIGNDFAVFSVCDLDGACVNDTVFFIVSPIANIPPDVFNDFYTVVQDGSITDNLLNNDSDPDGTLSSNTTAVVNPANGIISIQASGDFTYTPNAGFIGFDTVVVQVCDNSLACVNDTLFFTVTLISNLPVVVNDTISIQEDNNAISNILLNDSDLDGPVSASLIVVLNPAHGTVNIDASGNYAYSPNSNYNGNDTIVFSVCDTDNNCINDTLFVTILPVNDNIIVANENVTTDENTPFSGSIIGNDADPDGTAIVVNTTAVVLPSNGIVLINANGTFDYLPNAGFIGIDTIVVITCDSGLPLPATCSNDTIFITVIDINSPPIVFNENVNTSEDIAISGTVITIDSDPDGTPLITDTIAVYGPLNGSVILNQNGNFTYSPSNNFNGVDTIVVQICDSGLPLPAACSFDTIFITINAINDAPLVINDTISTLSNQPVSDNILLNDTDIENTVLTADSVNITGPSNGTLVLNSNGDYSYTPNNGYYGQDTIFINVCDSGLPLPVSCVTDTLIITINPVAAIANAGSDQTICADSLVLNANPTPVGNGLWTVVTGVATFADSSLFNTTVNNLTVGQNILVWSISSTSGITTDTVIINVTPSLAPPNAGTDHIICAFTDSLNANLPVVGNGTWSVASGSGIIADPNTFSTTVSSLGVGNNLFVWTVSNGICPAVSDTMMIVVTAQPTNAAAGTDLQICGTSIQLSGNPPLTGVGHWKKMNTATTISDTLNAQTFVFNLGVGSNSFVWVIENGVCAASMDTVEIFTFQNSTAPLAGNDTTICQNEITLNANVIDIGIGQWGVVTSNGTLIDFNANNAQITNLNEGENILIWTSVNGICPIQSDTIIIQFQACPDTTVFIPGGFSPNGDGANDVFIISGTGGAMVSVQIFNRWGAKVYENNNYQNDWAGTNEDSKELLDATYYYIIKVVGEEKARTGYITLWR